MKEPTNIRSIFSQRLKALRESKGLNYSQLAEQLGVSSASLGYYERGERVPDIEVLGKLCEYFEVKSDYLIGKSNSIDEATHIMEILGLDSKVALLLMNYKHKCALVECLISKLYPLNASESMHNELDLNQYIDRRKMQANLEKEQQTAYQIINGVTIRLLEESTAKILTMEYTILEQISKIDAEARDRVHNQ